MEWGWLAERQVIELQRENRRHDIKHLFRLFLQGVDGVPETLHLIAVSLNQGQYYTGITKSTIQHLTQQGTPIYIGLFSQDSSHLVFWRRDILPKWDHAPSPEELSAVFKGLDIQVTQAQDQMRYLLTIRDPAKLPNPAASGWNPV